MKKFCKLFVSLILIVITGITLVGCGTVKLNNDDGIMNDANEETEPQEQWWVGTYDWKMFKVYGNPDSTDQLYVNHIYRMCPSSTYGNTIELTDDGKIIDTDWGYLDSVNNETTHGTYVIDYSQNVNFTYGTEQEITIKRPLNAENTTDTYFSISKEGLMLQWLIGSKNFVMVSILQKRSE